MPQLVDRNLTDSTVRSAKARADRYELFDAKVRGLGIRVGTSGTKTWFVMKRVNGRMTRRSLGRYPEVGLHEARTLGAEELAKMARGQNSTASQRKVSASYAEWLQRDQAQNRTALQVKRAFKLHVLPKLGQRSLDSIQKKDVLEIIDSIYDSGAKVQANRVLAFMRRFFNWCIERDYLEDNPTRGVPKPAREVSRDRVLSVAELKNVLKASADIEYPFGQFVQLLVLTGQRRDEVAGMRWSEVGAADSIWTLPGSRSKNGKTHIVHLSNSAVTTLEGLPRLAGVDLVFPATRAKRKNEPPTVNRPISGFSSAKRRLDKASGVYGWTMHDLRRTFATHCTERLGINPVVVDKILNHQSGTVRGIAAVYQRGEYLTERRNALEAWGTWIAELRDA